MDMYLHAEMFVSGYEFRGESEVKRFKGMIEALGMESVVDSRSPSATVTLTLGYWRKANHIHKWFVENVQDGVDECQKAPVTIEQLTELRDLCREVLASLKMTKGMVHTTSGFFSGSTDYEYYKYDLENTVKICDRVLGWLKDPPEGAWSPSIYYQSSW